MSRYTIRSLVALAAVWFWVVACYWLLPDRWESAPVILGAILTVALGAMSIPWDRQRDQVLTDSDDEMVEHMRIVGICADALEGDGSTPYMPDVEPMDAAVWMLAALAKHGYEVRPAADRETQS